MQKNGKNVCGKCVVSLYSMWPQPHKPQTLPSFFLTVAIVVASAAIDLTACTTTLVAGLCHGKVVEVVPNAGSSVQFEP